MFYYYFLQFHWLYKFNMKPFIDISFTEPWMFFRMTVRTHLDLHLAALHGHNKVVELLLNQGVAWAENRH